MVTRSSNTVEFSGGQGRAEYAQAGGGYVNPDPQKVVGDGGASANAALIQSILGDVKGVMDVGVKTSREEAYLAGAALAATGEAEEALESSFTTKDWAVAGYRDTAGKLKMADAEASLPEDMKLLRQESPEKMAEYLAERRAKLAPSLDGMSREQRTAAFGQMLLSDRAAIANHAKEHAAFQVEQIVTTKQAEFSTYKMKLDAALKSGDEPTYRAAVADFAMGFVGGSIMNEPRFDGAMRQKMATQAIDDALGSGNVMVYEALQATAIPEDINNPTGPSRSIISMLSLDNQRKLSDSYRSAYNQTEGARDLDMHNAISYMKAGMNEGTYTGGVDGVVAMQKRILQSNPNNGAMASSLMDHFLSEKVKDHPNVPLIISHVMSGNFAALDAMNVSPTQAVEFMDKQWAKDGVTAVQKVPLLISMLGTGNPVIANKLGGTVDGIMRSFAFTTDMPPDNQATLKGVLGYIEGLKRVGGKDAALGQFYAGMPEDSAVRIQRLLAAGAVNNPKEAIVAVRDIEHREANMSPADKAATKLESSKALNAYIDNIKPMGQWERFKAHFTPFGASSAQATLSPSTSMWSSETDNSDVTNKYVADSQTALREEANAYALAHPTDTPETVVRNAEQGAIRRTLVVGNSPLIVPFGKSPNEYFGLNGTKLVASPEQLGKAVEMVTPKTDPSNRMTYTISGDTIQVKEFNSDGVATGNSYNVDRKEVAKAVAMQQDNKKKEVNAAYGIGIAVPVGEKTLTINGDNTAAMSNENMITIRKNLSKFEGFTKGIQQDVGKQKDAAGKDVVTTGVGISSTNTYFKEAAEATTPEQHLEVFRKASNEAATNAVRLTKALGLRGDSWQVLATEIIYQAGIGNVTGTTDKDRAGDAGQLARSLTYKLLLANRDPAKAVELLEATPVFKMSQKSRQRHYRALIQSAVLGE